VDPRAGLDGRKSRPHRDSIPDRPTRSSVAIPTELHGPYIYITLYIEPWTSRYLLCYNANVKQTSQEHTVFEVGTLMFPLTCLRIKICSLPFIAFRPYYAELNRQINKMDKIKQLLYCWHHIAFKIYYLL